MQQTAKKQDPANPLELLSDQLDTDMKQVNATIIDRMQSPVALIPQLASYLIAAGGKRIRPLLTLATTEIYSGNMDHSHKLAAAVEFIHTATLLHDDVVDESDTRRGQDAANLIFGNQASVLVGDFLFSRAFELMTDCDNIQVLKILSNASAVITQGEVLQLTAANNLDTSMDEYIEIITSKTAALFSAACEVGPTLANASDEQSKAMYDYGLYLGIAFQIADDALDYSADRAVLGKTIGDDFREGKVTAPILFALENQTPEEKEFWIRTINESNQTDDDLAKAQDILKKYSSIQKSLELAQSYAALAQQALEKAPKHPLVSLLNDLAPYTIFRNA